MRKALAFIVVVALMGAATAASADDFFSFHLQGQAGYTSLSNIGFTSSTGSSSATLNGFAFGGRALLKILIITLMVDYQHFLSNADYLHAGLGLHWQTDAIPVIRPYVGGSAGVMLLAAKKEAFGSTASDDMKTTLGFQARVGGGLEFPFASVLAIGVSADVGYHYITSNSGWDLSVMGYFGLRLGV